MLEPFETARKLFLGEGLLKSINPIPHLKSWTMTIVPFYPDTEKVKQAKLTFSNVIFISFRGFNYQTGIHYQDTETQWKGKIPIVCWGENNNSQLLNDYFSGKMNTSDPRNTSCIFGNPEEHQGMKHEFHHIFFEGFHVCIDILCRNVEIDIKKAKDFTP